jgi:hypothetical protein
MNVRRRTYGCWKPHRSDVAAQQPSPSDTGSVHLEHFLAESEQTGDFGINIFRPNFAEPQSLDVL